MFARLLLALLLTAFALPALANAPCHDAPARAMAGHHSERDMPRPDDRATAPHVCIGCIPPASVLPVALTPPLIVPAVPRDLSVETISAGVGLPPAVPPPRRTA